MKNRVKLILVFALVIVVLSSLITVNANNEKLVKKVLIIHSDEEFIPANIDVNAALVSRLKSSEKFAVTIFSEYLDKSRLFSDQLVDDYTMSFLKRYRDIKPDIIIAVDFKAFLFLKNEAAEFYTSTPLVFCMIPKRLIDESTLPDNITGNYMSIDALGSIEVLLHMHPETEEVVIVSGAGPASQSKLREINDNLLDHDLDIKISFLQDKTIGQTLDVLSELPDKTIVLYNSIFEDADGTLFIPREALALMNDVTSVPIYGLYFTNLDYGLVGGSLFEFKEVAYDAAEKVLAILDGTDPSTLAILEVENKRYFNWSLFDKWNIDESKLPENSIVLNKEYTLWELYRYQIIGIVIFIIVETVLIVYLIMLQVLRKKAEEDLNRLNLKLEETVEERTESLHHSNTTLAEKNSLLEEEIIIRISVEEELNAVVQTLSETQTQLIAVEKQAAINHLIQNLLHRINTPLGNSLLYVDLLEKKSVDMSEFTEVIDHLKNNNKQLVSTMETLNSMLYIKNDEKASLVDLEKYVPIILYETFLDNKSNIVAICYPNKVVKIREKNFKKLLLSLSEFAKVQRETRPNLKRAEIIFEMEDNKLIIYYKDKALDHIKDVEKIFDPYVYNSFKTSTSGLELVVLFNTVTVGMEGDISLVEGKDKIFNRMLMITLPLTDL